MLSKGLIEDLGDQPPELDSPEFLARLRLRRVDRDIFTGWCHAGAPLRAFGGQVAAHALVAAGATVDDDARDVHSLHAYFLRPGRTRDPIVYLVDRPRDGRSFTTRRVRAVQYGETIFALSASFAGPQSGPEHMRDRNPAWWDALPEPASLPPAEVFDHITLAVEADAERRKAVLQEAGYPSRQLFDLRVIEPPRVRELSGGSFDRMVWVRSVQALPNNHLINVCVMTYFSDLNMAGTVLGAHGGRRGTAGLEIASIDHAMWFHSRFWSDEWMLFATKSPTSGNGRGFARGEFYRTDGVLAASTAQEVLVRRPFPKS